MILSSLHPEPFNYSTSEALAMSKSPTWDQHIAVIDALQGIEARRKRWITTGFLAIRETLGEDWLSLGWENRIPVLSLLPNRAAWAQYSLAAFGWRLKRARHLPGFDRVKGQFLDPDKFDGAATQIRLASRYAAAGYDIALEPDVAARRADLRVATGPDVLYIELKQLHSSLDDRQADATMHAALEALGNHARDLTYEGTIFKTLSTPRLQELATQIRATAQRVRGNGEDARIFAEGAYDITLALDEARAGGGGLTGPASGATDLTRLRGRIRDAA